MKKQILTATTKKPCQPAAFYLLHIPKVFLLLFLLLSCSPKKENNTTIISGKVPEDTKYIVLHQDTIETSNGFFSDTLHIQNNYYDYIQLDTWKWPKLVFLEKNKPLSLDLSNTIHTAENDAVNTYLLHVDSILNPYSLTWNMTEKEFRTALQVELHINIEKIDSIFKASNIDQDILKELKHIEILKVAHRTANFISFQERKNNPINRDIYNFIKGIDLNNRRLEKQINNRNFQYYYLLDKIDKDLPDTLYPFAAIDTLNTYSSVESIKKMIISSVVKSAFFNEEINHEKLINKYERTFGPLQPEDELSLLYAQIQGLTPGNKAPTIGDLEDINGNYVSIEDLLGQNILITVWGTWCPYCKEELIHLKKLQHEYGDNFTSVSISFDKDKSKWKSYLIENEWTGIHLIDSKRNSIFKKEYLIRNTNVHFLVDKDGVILSSRSLKPSSKELEQLILNLD